MEQLVTLAYVVGILYFLVGRYSKMRPKKIDGRGGYRTRRSKSSQAAWNFAQQYSASAFQWAGLGLIALGLGAPYLPLTGPHRLAVPFTVLFVLLVVIPVASTEWALRRKFK